MKIVVVVPGGFDPSGRVRVIPALLWLVEQLAHQHQIYVCALEGAPAPPRYMLHGAEVHLLGPARGAFGLRVAQLWPQLLGALETIGRPDVIHGFWAGRSGLLAGMAARYLGVPAVLSIGGGELVWLPEIDYGGGGTVRGRVVARLALRLAHTITAGSQYAARPLAGRQVQIVPLGIAAELLAGPVERTLGPPWQLLHVASINRVKDPPTLLRALRRMADNDLRFHLDWVGEDTLGGAIQQMCAGLGLAEHVTFHGFMPSDGIVPFYRAAHLHLLSSRHESQAVVVAEAAAAGLPTVGTAVGVLAELAPDAALAVAVGDAAALADAALALLGDPARRYALGQAAQAWARAHDARWTAAQFTGLYAELAGR